MNFYNKTVRQSTANEIKQKRVSPLVADAICTFNNSLYESPKRSSNLDLLRNGNCLTVTTGQQLSLFGGPMLNFYKALSACSLAKRVSEDTGCSCVPVFWLQSEDHDFEEINSCILPTPENKLITLQTTGETEGQKTEKPKTSVFYLSWSEEITSLHKTLHDNLNFFPFASVYLEKIAQFYSTSTSISSSFANFFSYLFKEEGLIFIEPNVAPIKDSIKGIYQSALTHEEEITKALQKKESDILARGGKTQVHIRKDSPLFFYQKELGSSPRFRIQKLADNSWGEIGGDYEMSTSFLLSEIENSPQKFSSSALLRPIIQDSLLPNFAYVGGEAELQYLKQIEPLYDLFNKYQSINNHDVNIQSSNFASTKLSRSFSLPRAHFVIIEPKVSKWLEQLKLTLEDLNLPEAELTKKVISSFEDSSVTSSKAILAPERLEKLSNESIQNLLEILRDNFSQLNKQLLDPLEKNFDKISHSLKVLNEKYLKEFARQDSDKLNRLLLLKQAVFPNSQAQERVISVLYFLCRYGDTLKEKLYESYNKINFEDPSSNNLNSNYLKIYL